ncbi:calcium-binding protein [Nocardioides sp. S-58]|uniref:Calcium-binding protein n=1 Tax=Nocardioides renjunii TaxID=3095075 RepID=A0ABU5KGL3_9ACTN|nr:calcium-binding protein [Nocardioides sp. S-58]MDZ5664094.1 calcium-binding protein [Nocardioides sp. S-58]
MRRTTTLTAAGLLGLALLAPTTSATAAAQTCRGEAATIVGTGARITGTEGRDVIVTATAGVVDARGGDDLICVAVTDTSSNALSVAAGAGADVVDTTATSGTYYVSSELGPGTDSYFGGSVNDTVYGGDRAAPQTDTEADTIDTGAGGDGVFTGSPGTPNRDVVRLGDGPDQLYLGAPALAADAVVDGGAGGDALRLAAGDGDLAVDMVLGTFTTAAGTASFGSFEAIDLSVGDGTVGYRGTEGPDDLDVQPVDGTPVLQVATGGGDDSVSVAPATIAAGSRFDAGAGQDDVVAATRTGRLAVDLPGDLLAVDGVEVPARGVEHAWLLAPTVAMTGDADDNDLTWTGCDAVLRGGPGDDSLRWAYDLLFESYEFDCVGDASVDGGDGRDTVRGNSGDDRLIGGPGRDQVEGRGGSDRIRGGGGNDVLDGGEGRDDVRGEQGRDVLRGRASADTLLGGPGRDTADGSNGRDRCVAERQRGCER